MGYLRTVSCPFFQAVFTDNILHARSCARSGVRSAEKKQANTPLSHNSRLS